MKITEISDFLERYKRIIAHDFFIDIDKVKIKVENDDYFITIIFSILGKKNSFSQIFNISNKVFNKVANNNTFLRNIAENMIKNLKNNAIKNYIELL